MLRRNKNTYVLFHMISSDIYYDIHLLKVAEMRGMGTFSASEIGVLIEYFSKLISKLAGLVGIT